MQWERETGIKRDEWEHKMVELVWLGGGGVVVVAVAVGLPIGRRSLAMAETVIRRIINWAPKHEELKQQQQQQQLQQQVAL